MRRSLFSPADGLAAVVVAALLVSAPVPAVATPDATDHGPPGGRSVAASRVDLSVGRDPTAVVPTLQAAFGERYGGVWIEPGPPADTLHVAVVRARPADETTVARLTAGVPRVAVDSVTHSFDDLLAAQDEIALSLDRTTDYAVEADIATNRVVVRTEARDAAAIAATAAEARVAARRGVEAASLSAAATGDPRAPTAGLPGGTPSRRPPSGVDGRPASDLATAVRIERTPAIEILPAGPAAPRAPVNVSRNSFPPYESGLRTIIAVGSRHNVCTTGLLFRNGLGYFGSTAGHCGRVRDGVVIGSRVADIIRTNGFQGHRWVMADAALVSMSARGWSVSRKIHSAGPHRFAVARYRNSQIAVGLGLCFEGLTSGSNNCGRVVRANQWICCDAGGRSYYYSCLSYPSRPGDSGGPVYRPVTRDRAAAAGMVSASVTIGGRASTCFTTVESIEYILRSRMVT